MCNVGIIFKKALIYLIKSNINAKINNKCSKCIILRFIIFYKVKSNLNIIYKIYTQSKAK